MDQVVVHGSTVNCPKCWSYYNRLLETEKGSNSDIYHIQCLRCPNIWKYHYYRGENMAVTDHMGLFERFRYGTVKFGGVIEYDQVVLREAVNELTEFAVARLAPNNTDLHLWVKAESYKGNMSPDYTVTLKSRYAKIEAHPTHSWYGLFKYGRVDINGAYYPQFFDCEFEGEKYGYITVDFVAPDRLRVNCFPQQGKNPARSVLITGGKLSVE